MKKTAKKTKKDNSSHKEIRHLGVIVEHIDDKVSLIAEQYGDIKNTLDKHTRILETHTEMIGSIKEDIEIIKMDIEFIKGDFKKKVDIEEFAALERRVALLEKRRVSR